MLASQSRGPRVAQACFRCQEKKTRCNATMPSCSSCLSKKLECVYPELRKRRGPGKSAQRMKVLEDRLAKMETELHKKNSHPSSEADQSLTANTILLPNDPLKSSSSQHERVRVPLPRSGFAFLRDLSDRLKADKLGELAQGFRGIVQTPMIPQEAEKFLLRSNIDQICNELPLFHVPSFLELLEQEHSLERRTRTSWWACLNSTAAIAIPMRTVNRDFSQIAVFAWALFKNAYAVFPELAIHGRDLASVQAVLAMVMFMRLSADSGTTAILLSSAIRMTHMLGLHEKVPHRTRSAVEEETRSRVFWTAYILDIEMSVNLGLPPLQADTEIDVDLPFEVPSDGCGIINLGVGRVVNIFRLRTELAVIQSRIRKELYGPKWIRQTDSDHLMSTVVSLESALEAWKSALLTELQPPLTGRPDEVELENSTALLHMIYHNSISMLHWVQIHYNYWSGRDALTDTPGSVPRDQLMISVNKIGEAARSVINLLQYLPSQQFTDLWHLLPYPLTASLILVTIVLCDSRDTNASEDARHIGIFATFLEKAMQEEEFDLRDMHRGVSTMDKIAATSVQNAESQSRYAVCEQSQAIGTLLSSATHPMHLAQRLMGNLPKDETDIARTLADILGMAWDEGSQYGPFTPRSLQPETHGFVFETPEQS